MDRGRGPLPGPKEPRTEGPGPWPGPTGTKDRGTRSFARTEGGRGPVTEGKGPPPASSTAERLPTEHDPLGWRQQLTIQRGSE